MVDFAHETDSPPLLVLGPGHSGRSVKHLNGPQRQVAWMMLATCIYVEIQSLTPGKHRRSGSQETSPNGGRAALSVRHESQTHAVMDWTDCKEKQSLISGELAKEMK